MERLIQDIRYGFRKLIKTPIFTIVTVFTLALGIGGNSAMFTLFNTVLLRPLPFKDPNNLMMVWNSNLKEEKLENTTSPLNYTTIKSQTSSFSQVEAFRYWPFIITGVDEPERIWGVRVSGGLFDLLGAKPHLGRVFVPDDDQPGKGNIIILSHGLWKRRFGSDTSIIGKAVTLNDASFTVVGVMDSDFQFPIKGLMPILTQTQVDLWTPLAFTNQQVLSGNRALGVIARLKPDSSVIQAQGDVEGIAATLAQQYPQFNGDWGLRVVPLQEQISGKIKPTLLLLFIAVGLVLLIACANVASLLLARGAARQKEIAIRTALGASRRRLMLQLLTESMVLSIIGGILGLLLSVWVVKIIVATSPDSIPLASNIRIDKWVLVFTFLVSLITGLIFGLLPAREASKLDISQFIKEGVKELAGKSRRIHVRSILVISEIALASILLIGAGLMMRSFLRLQEVDPGFKPDGILTMQIDLPGIKYSRRILVADFYDKLFEKIRTQPGMEQVSGVSVLPFSSEEEENGFFIEGRPAPNPTQPYVAPFRTVDPNYFATMGIPLISGRFFNKFDTENAPGVTIINQTMARLYWPDEDPLGKRFAVGQPGQAPWLTIVGVVGDIRHADLSAEAKPGMFFPYRQWPLPFLSLVVRSNSDPAQLISIIRSQLDEIDKDQPISTIKTLDQMLYESVSHPRLRTYLVVIFAGIAIILAIVGLYGLMSYSVSQRSREIAIRMALGAQQTTVLTQIVKEGAVLAVSGIIIGLGTSFILTRVLASMLYGISVTDPTTFIAAPVMLVGVALIASYFPARSATRINPMNALREQ